MSKLKPKFAGKTLLIRHQNKTGVYSHFWMTEYGLQRHFFKREVCTMCGEARIKRYVIHPFNLPLPYAKGHWLVSDCACVKKERFNERQTREQILLTKNNYELPAGLRQHTFSSFQVTELNRQAHEVCQQFARNFSNIQDGQGLLLLGRSGTGKTHLASAIANSLQKQLTVAFVYMPILIEKFRFAILPLDVFLSVDLLILDDIGSERESGATLERLLAIVDGRLTNLKPTIFTTNYDIKDLDIRIGMRTASRILGHNLQLVLQGPDWRLRRVKGSY